MRTTGISAIPARRARRALLTGLLSIAAAAAFAAPAQASLEIVDFTTETSTTVSGGHPDLTTSFALEDAGVSESARTVTFNAPEGLFGNPNAIFRCSSSDFALEQCPSSSQAGLVTVYANYEGDPEKLLGTAPLYDLEPAPDQTGLFALIVPTLNLPMQIPVSVRTGSDYGLRFAVSELTQVAPLAAAKLTFWGFPADPSHKAERFPKGKPGEPAGCVGLADTSCTSGAAASIPNKPLINNPTICTGKPLVTSLEVRTYQDPANPTSETGSYPATTNCDQQVFKPVLFGRLTTNETDAPTGLSLEVRVPQSFGFSPSPSQLRTSSVELPPGLTINPDAADGQTACKESEANFNTEAPAQCPDSSKIGTFRVNTAALDGPLLGSIYIGQPEPNQQYRLFLTADGFGVHIKLAGIVLPDATDGQVTFVISDLPQVPFDNFQVHLFASDRGLLATPTRCGLYEITAHLFPWNARLPDVFSTDFASLESGPHGAPCPGQVRPFEPRLVAGTSTPAAGQFSSFTLRLDRDDGDQFLGDLTFRMPPGFTGSLRGISYCPEGSIAAAAQKAGLDEKLAPSCPASSQIGTTNVAAGPGGHPFHAVGKMYLSGPFKGAPLSLAAVTPALAGPYDYGTVVVRVALHVDPRTAQVSAASDTVPSIIGGVPLRLRSIQVNIDRDRFTINPTNCSPFAVDSQGIGDQGTVTDFSSYFQAVNCATLPFKPRMTIRQLGSRKATKRTRNPRLRFDLFTRGGDANLRSLAVTLPKAFAIDQRHLGNICSKSQLEAELCKGRQPIGNAWVRTPLLDEPLKGPAYAVSGFGKLPRVAFVLDGQVTLLPQAESSSVRNGHLKTVVPVIPDAPVGHFRLTLLGGSKGYLVNTRDLCASKTVAGLQFVGQNGRRRNQRVRVKTPCGSKRAAKRSAHGGH
jgi:hypothetical protein